MGSECIVGDLVTFPISYVIETPRWFVISRGEVDLPRYFLTSASFGSRNEEKREAKIKDAEEMRVNDCKIPSEKIRCILSNWFNVYEASRFR